MKETSRLWCTGISARSGDRAGQPIGGGRKSLIPTGVVIAAFSAGVLVLQFPLILAAAAVTTLSFGYDMTQPLLAGIVTSLDPKCAGHAMGLNVFPLFIGFGIEFCVRRSYPPWIWSGARFVRCRADAVRVDGDWGNFAGRHLAALST